MEGKDKKGTTQSQASSLAEGQTKIYIPRDETLRNTIRDRIAKDLKAGVLDSLTQRIAQSYGLTTHNDIRIVQHQLTKQELLVQRGNRFIRKGIAA